MTTRSLRRSRGREMAVGLVLMAVFSRGCASDATTDVASNGGTGGSGGQAGSVSGSSGQAGTAGSSGNAGSSGVSGTSGSSGTAGVSGASGGGGTAGIPGTMGCTGVPRPASIPADWQEYTGWSCQCPMFIPGNSATQPSPLQWGACDFDVPSGVQCQRLIGPGGGIAVSPYFSRRRSDGAPLLLANIPAPEYGSSARYTEVAAVDGKVLTAFLQLAPQGGCNFEAQGLNEDRYALIGYRDQWLAPAPEDPRQGGALAGIVGESLPSWKMKYQEDPNLSANWSVSEQWIVQRKGDRTAFRWDGSSSTIVYSASSDPDGAPGHQTTVLGSNVFVEGGSYGGTGVSVWTEAQGQKALIRSTGDFSKGEGNFGTDGTDMVWTLAEGFSSNNPTDYTKVSVMTAPYTTSSASVSATQRRLRSDKTGFDGGQWVVGCGFAARAYSSVVDNNALLITRLSDGQAWVLPGGAPGPQKFSWHAPLGITCEELFTEFSTTQADSTVVRIRLDSLGPGLPAD